ncbi:MAG: pectinacetylesterase family protein [Deltaproteobacteria bacterium]|nr:pectinacetylesterase family protein [Deltaproteobacteria bacterium]
MEKYNSALFKVGFLGIVLSVMSITVASGCGSSSTTTVVSNYLDRLHSMGVDKYIGLEPTAETTQTIDNSTWEVYYYDPSSPARCFNGKQYIVSLHRGDPQKVMLYLEGGGACWDYSTCYSMSMAKSSANPAVPMGFLDTTNPSNPFKDYSIIYASYCDASVWSGDNDVDFTGTTATTYFHGLANLSAAITLMKQNFINPSEIVVSGSSAGGYGTFMGYFVARTQYPFTTLNVINDSGVGLFNPQESALFRHILSTWNLSNILPTDCPKCSQQMSYLADWALNNDQNVNFGFFSYYNDMVIGSVFLQMNTSDFKNLLLSVTNDIHRDHPHRFERFFVDGGMHTVLELPDYYTMGVSGTTLSQWTADMVTDTAGWKDTLQ